MNVGFVGRMQTGKTTSAEYLVNNYGFSRVSIAEPVKEIATRFFRMKRKNRRLLQTIGVNMRQIEPNCWVNYLTDRVGHMDGDVVVDDVRFVNEAEILEDKNFVLIKLVRSVNYSEKELIYSKHQSEMEVDKIYTQYVVDNNSTLEGLYKQIDLILKEAGEVR